MTSLPKPKRYTLDCNHVIWLRQPPSKGDVLWCSRCERYEPLLLAETSRYRRIIDPNGEFWSERFGSKFKGGCLKDGCEYEYNSASNWDSLRNKLHTHYMREHTRFGATLEIRITDRLTPGSEPPF